MRLKAKHFSSEELLLFLDGELGERRSFDVQRHLAGCLECRRSACQMRETLSELIDVHRQRFERAWPRIDGPRALLRARLRREEQQPDGRAFGWNSWAALFASAAAAAFLAISFFHASSSGVLITDKPNAVLTPGAFVTATAAQVCSVEVQEKQRELPVSVKRRIFDRYGMRHARYRDFEVDYLVTPELGGTDSVRNLWPEPYHDTVWNAHVKDQLEVRLHQLVCGRQISLATAQHDIAVDWIAAYQKYFATKKPLEQRELLASFSPLRFTILTDEESVLPASRYQSRISE